MASIPINCVKAQLVSTPSCPAHWIITFNESDSWSKTATSTKIVQWTPTSPNVHLDAIEYGINEGFTLSEMKESMLSPKHLMEKQVYCCCQDWVWAVLWSYMNKGYIKNVSTAGTDSNRLLESLVERKYNPQIMMNPDEDLSITRWPASFNQFDFHATPYFIRVSAVIFSWSFHIDSLEEAIEDANINAKTPRVLLLQRALCDSKPGLWEGPGGGVEGDKTLLQAITRETHEETGLQVSRIIRPLSVMRWKRKKESGIFEWVGFPYIVGITEKRFPKMQTIQERSQDVQLNPREHQKFAWVTEEELRKGGYEMLEGQRDTFLEAFSLFRKGTI
ncbi:hypothetical protein FE257_003372 [Aspergillus nanangensis]|uniref:Nudix hydrolase domain-containing protein n=1 Tax=Aspergillus nanangensis TaxID=2582783 RepID=A0AAD4CBR4_ASPNN|nr:hypothetical protein FE257_003372 [Aspergillus nanangensis]